jgi:hypothetical protein
MDISESSFSRMLNRPDSLILAKGCLNRAARRRLAALRSGTKGKRPLVIIDSTLTGRRVKYVENASFYKLGKQSIRGHKLINFVLYLYGVIVLLSVVAHYSRAYIGERGVRLHYASPGDKNENAFIESFNGKLRDECLNMHWFSRLSDAREIIEAWRIDYNEVRSHRSLNGLSPSKYRKSKELKLAA